MAAQSKAQLLNEIHTLLKKRYKPKPDRGGKLSVLEAIVYAACHEGATREQAQQALARFKDGFFDWNEVRVSSIEEVQAALTGLPDSEPRAHRIRRFLRQLFEKTYGFTLEALTKKPMKESLKALSEYDAFGSDYVEASVTQLALNGHAMPVDAPARRALTRLGVADPAMEAPAIRSLLERAVPKNRGPEFCDLLEDLAHDTCVEGEPDCPRCELRKICPTAALKREESAQAAKVAAAQAKAAAKAALKPAAPAPAPAPGPTPPPAPAKAAPAPAPVPAPKAKAAPAKAAPAPEPAPTQPPTPAPAPAKGKPAPPKPGGKPGRSK